MRPVAKWVFALAAVVVGCSSAGSSTGGTGAGPATGGTSGAGYRHWQRDVHSKADYSLDDFSADDPRLSQALEEESSAAALAPLTPKFRWTQDPRHVFITVLVKNLEFASDAVQHDRWWLNFTASGDFQRTVGARHDSTEARTQGGKRHSYSLSLPLTRPVAADRMERRGSEGYTVFEIRKETPNSEWTHLVKEPARSAYRQHMRVDFKSKFDRSDADDDDDIWASHEFRVERVTDANVDDVISTPGIVILLFFPSWVHPQFSHYWAHNFAGAAQALEGRATLAVVNGLAESAAPVLKRYNVQLSQQDGNSSRPVYRVFVDGGKLIPEGYSGETDGQQLIAFVERLEGVCDDPPCPAVHQLISEADLELLMGRHELSAIAVGMKEADGLRGALANVTRSLQAVGSPPYNARAKGVGVGWVGGGPAFNMLSSQLQGMPKINLQDIDFPAILLVRVPGAPDGSDPGMAPPIMTTAASIVRPADGKKFKKAELEAGIGGWGFKNQGVVAEGSLEHVHHATRCGVSTVVLALGEDGGDVMAAASDDSDSQEDAKTAEGDQGTDEPDPQEPGAIEAEAVTAANTIALEGLREFNAHNRSAPLQALVHRASDGRGADALRRLAAQYGWSPSHFPALAIIRGDKVFAYPDHKGHNKYGALNAQTIRAFAADFGAKKVKPVLRSEQPTAPGQLAGPGSGEVDRVVASDVRKFLDQGEVDRVLAVYDSTDELSERRRGSLGKVAAKMAHVSTIAFGALDMSKNDIPAPLATMLGDEAKRYEGIWLFKAGLQCCDSGSIGERCKRKASTKDLAAWVRKQASTRFPARVPDLPPGPYVDTCSGCRIMSVHEVLRLRCKQCNGGSATQLMTEMDLSACSGDHGFANVGGQLGCADADAVPSTRAGATNGEL